MRTVVMVFVIVMMIMMMMIIFISINTEIFSRTRSYAALRAADLVWIVGPDYSLGRYIFGDSQLLRRRSL